MTIAIAIYAKFQKLAIAMGYYSERSFEITEYNNDSKLYPWFLFENIVLIISASRLFQKMLFENSYIAS